MANKVRTIFVSDLHLGSKAAQADEFLKFIKEYDSNQIVLVGDIIDGWRLKRQWYWPQNCNDVIQKLLRKSRKGTDIIYIPGNHDEMVRQIIGVKFENIIVKMNHEHITADGKKILILHGDEFDMVINHHKWLAVLGDMAYSTLIKVNHLFNWYRRKRNLPYWSLSAYAKKTVKRAVSFIGNFEQIITDYARNENYDFVMCGHIHMPDIKQINGITYLNTGDWVETCSAIVEHFDGSLELLVKTEQGLIRKSILIGNKIED